MRLRRSTQRTQLSRPVVSGSDPSRHGLGTAVGGGGRRIRASRWVSRGGFADHQPPRGEPAPVLSAPGLRAKRHCTNRIRRNAESSSPLHHDGEAAAIAQLSFVSKFSVFRQNTSLISRGG